MANLFVLVHDVPPEPDDQFDWIEKWLSQAEDLGEKVIISGHIPPCSSGSPQEHEPPSYLYWRPDLIDRFSDMMARYKSTVVGTFWGHEHPFQLHVINDNNGLPVQMAYAAPSITPQGGDAIWRHNPAFMVYILDDEYNLVDFAPYSVELESQTPEYKPIWWPRDHFEIEDIDPRSWAHFFDEMIGGNDTKWDLYMKVMQSGAARVDCPDDVSRCKHMHMCSARYNHVMPFTDCTWNG